MKDWATKVAALEADEMELEKRLQALQENQRQKREAVVKEERCQQDACRCSPGKRRMHQPRSPEAQAHEAGTEVASDLATDPRPELTRATLQPCATLVIFVISLQWPGIRS